MTSWTPSSGRTVAVPIESDPTWDRSVDVDDAFTSRGPAPLHPTDWGEPSDPGAWLFGAEVEEAL